jgi:tripartite-type tricarboxylate transporter receptor subunit TctC
MAELGYANVDVAPWCGLAAPTGTPEIIVARWNELANEALRDPKTREQIAALDYDVRGGTVAQFADFLARDISRYKKLAEDMGLAEE